MEHVHKYDQLIVKRMFMDGYSFSEALKYLRAKYGNVNPKFVYRLKKEVENGKGDVY